MTQSRHSWIEEAHVVSNPLGFTDRTGKRFKQLVPTYPMTYIPTGGRKLFRCKHCSWWRITAKTVRGADTDFFYFNQKWEGRKFRWSSFYVNHRPKCGDES